MYIGSVDPDNGFAAYTIYRNAGCTCGVAHREELKRAYKILIGKSEWKPRERPNLYGD